MPTKKTTAKRTTSSTATNKTTEPTVETVTTGETSSPLDFSATTVQASEDTSSVNVGTFGGYTSEVSTTISGDTNYNYSTSTATTTANPTGSTDTLSALMDMLAGMKQQMDSIQKELDSTKQELAQEKANNGFNKQNFGYNGTEVTSVGGTEYADYTGDYSTGSVGAVYDTVNDKTGTNYTQGTQTVNQIYNHNNNDSITPNRYDRLIDYMTNKKSDREVEIVHNRELIGGLTTHIELTGLTIDFRRLGEARTLSWQQFEECVSKYRKWFEKEIILLGAGNEELAETYAVPCQKRPGKRTITRTDLMRLGDLDVKQLEEYYNSLTAEDQHFIVSYWLGQCYSRTPKFYDRYKMETLNRLSNDGAFDNILTLMNGDYRLSQEELNGQAPQNQGGLTSANSMMNNINVIK